MKRESYQYCFLRTTIEINQLINPAVCYESCLDFGAT